MKSFWISLLVFILFMCGCKTKKLESSAAVKTAVASDISAYHESLKQDTTRLTNFAQTENKWHLRLTQTIKEYDKVTGVLTKETKTEGEVTQDTEQTTSQEEQRALNESFKDSLNHIREATKKVDSEVKQEFIGGQESFGKWLGIGISIIILVFLIIVWSKIKKYLNL